MILTVNIGNTHITIAGYEHDTLQFSGRLHSSPAATVDEYAMNLLNLLSLYQVAPERIEGGILGSVVPALTGRVLGALQMLCSARFPDRWPRPEKRHQAAVGQPCPAGQSCWCPMPAGGGGTDRQRHLGRYRHLHHGSQRQTGTGGRCHSARAAALPFRAGAKNCPAASDRSLRSGFLLDLGRTPLPAYRTVLCWAPPGCWMGWPSVFRQSLARISAFMPPATCPAPSGKPAAHRSNTASI